MGSMKSGPTLKPCTCTPRLRSAPRMPSTTEVLPTPLCVPAMTRRGSVLRTIVSVAILTHDPTVHEAQRQTGSARGIHHAHGLGNTRSLQRLKRIAEIRPLMFHTIIGTLAAEPDPKRPCHRRLRNAGIRTRMFTAVTPANPPATARIAPYE